MTTSCTTLYGKIKDIPTEDLSFRPNGYGICIQDRKILLVKMKNTDKYFFPGGGVDKGETVTKAVIRECQEETGSTVAIKDFLTMRESFFYYDPFDVAWHCFNFFYIIDVLSQATDFTNPDTYDEAIDGQWVEIDTLTPDQMQAFGWEIIQMIL